MGVLDPLSAISGVPEPSLRLLVTLVSGIPLALTYRAFLDAPSKIPNLPAVRNAYFVIAGLSASYFFNGSDVVHSLITVFTTYTLCAVVGGAFGARRLAAVLAWIFNAVYLLAGYYHTSSDDYDISWTMQQCVLCLRMMGFAMDYMDGADRNAAPTKAQKAGSPAASPTEADRKSKFPISFDADTPLEKLPSIFEVLGYSYFFGSFLIGPQFGFSLYKKFLLGTHLPKGLPPSGRTRYALRCVLIGVFYLAVQQVGEAFFSPARLTTPEFAAEPLFKKLVIVWFTGKFILNKYLGVWTLNEASCVLAGISYSGKDKDGNGLWDGLCNIDLWTFEFATSLTQIVASFNMNTNNWVKNYVFKRLRFLNNKNLSALSALMFLAIWHGTHPGYFLTFGLEFLDMEAERRLKRLVRPSIDSTLAKLKGPLATLGHALLTFSCWILTTGALNYAVCQFDALKLPLIRIILNSVGWFGHVVVLLIFVADFAVLAVFPPKRTKKVEDGVRKDKAQRLPRKEL